jgi:microcystin-dependent protein
MATTTQFIFANFFEAELVAGLTASSTTMLLSPSDAIKLPLIPQAAGEEARLVIWDGQLPPEIVGVVINDQSGLMTITRAKEGTTAQAWAAGTQVRSSITAEILNTALAAFFDFTAVLNAAFLKLTGGTLTGPLILSADPIVPLGAATKEYVDNSTTGGLPITGGTMLGVINMNTNPILNVPDPSGNQDAATKHYVDGAVAGKAALDSPNFTGTPSAPTQAPGDGSTRLATTAYVDGAAGGAAGAWSTGDIKLTIKSVADIGWLMMDDNTVGPGGSGAAHANNAYQALYTLLWNDISDTWAPVTGGRGASASADWAANKPIALPKTLGRALAQAGGGAGLTTKVLGSVLGEETHTLTTGEMPVHNHTLHDPSHKHSAFAGGVAALGSNITAVYSPNPGGTTFTSSDPTGITIDSAGSGTAHNNMQPSSFLNVMIKI